MKTTDAIGLKTAVRVLAEQLADTFFDGTHRLTPRILSDFLETMLAGRVVAFPGIVPGRVTYRHYKGGRYELITHALDASDGTTELVVYRSLENGTIWVRPAAEFFGKLQNGRDRFALER